MLIDIQSLYKIYNEGKESEVRALDGVSLQIEKGEFVRWGSRPSGRVPLWAAPVPAHRPDGCPAGQRPIGTVTSIDTNKAEQSSGMTSYPVTLTVENMDGSLYDGMWMDYSFVTSQSEDVIT